MDTLMAVPAAGSTGEKVHSVWNTTAPSFLQPALRQPPPIPDNVQVFDIAEGEHRGLDESDPGSENERFQRVRTAVKTIDLGDYPTAGAFRQFVGGLYTKVCAASNRTRQRTMKYLKRIEADITIQSVPKPSRAWEPLDTELLNAVLQCATAPLK